MMELTRSLPLVKGMRQTNGVLVEIYKDEASFESYRHSENYKSYAKERAGW